MTSLVRFWIAISLLFFFIPFSFAWNATAHQVIAKIAYDNIQPATKEKIDKLVSSFATIYPDINSFMQMAVWPDLLRAQQIEIFSSWHYIDIPFSQTPGLTATTTCQKENIIWALQMITPILQSHAATSVEKSRFLAFFIHFVGDIHQPLHAVTRLSEQYPEGDRGGNLFRVKYKKNDSSHSNLHAIWDHGVGLFLVAPTENNINKLAAQLTALYPESDFSKQIGNMNYDQWAEEDMLLAQSIVYRTNENTILTDDYIREAQIVAGKRVVLAGYRLAVLLNELVE